MARTVRDVALMLDIMAGPVVGEPYGLQPPAESFLSSCDRAPGRLRVAYSTTPPHGAIDPEVRNLFLASLAAFEEMGHDVVEAAPELDGFYDPFMAIVTANTAALTTLIDPARLADLEPSTIALMLRGQALSAADYCAAIDTARTRAAAALRFWTRYDVLLTPTLTLPPPLDGTMPGHQDLDRRWREYADFLAFTYPFNITGQPAISVPCGWTSEANLPVGLQIVGAPGREDQILSLAAAFEAARPWADRRPQVPFGPGSVLRSDLSG